MKSTGASASCGAVDEPSAVRLTAVEAGFGVAECASFISSSPAPDPPPAMPESAESLSSPSPRIARISGASTTLVLKSTRFSDTEPARTE